MKISNTQFNRSAGIGVLLLLSTILSGCTSDDFSTTSIDTAAPYSGSENFPIMVAKGPVTLAVASSNGRLEPAQINAIVGFAHQAMSAGLTPLTISRPNGGGASARVAGEIASLVVQQGMSRNRIRLVTYSAPASGAINLSYITTAARTKACGQWAEDVTETDANKNTANHGCAVQANIAAMVANPNTFYVPAPVTPIPAATRVPKIAALAGASTSSSSGSSSSSAPATATP